MKKVAQKHLLKTCNLKTVCMVVSLLFANAIFAQHYNYRFKHITNTDGLANSVVNVIYQDYTGFMWFGTLNGLHRYDGYEMQIFRHDPANRFSIAKNSIKSIYADYDNHLWITFSSSGISCFYPEKEKFVNFCADADSLGLYNAAVNHVFQDKDKTIWIGTDKGLCKYSGDEQSIKRHTITGADGNSIDFPCDYMIQSSNGLLWIVS